MRKNKSVKHIKGFTMIELLMTMTIIGVLASVLMIIVNPAEMQRRGRDSKRLSDMGMVKSAIDLTLADNSALVLPNTGAAGVAFGTDVTNFAGITGFNVSKYLPTMPKDPSGGSSATIIIDGAACTTGTGTPSYLFISNGSTYVIRANMESKTNCKTVTGDGSTNSTFELGTCVNMICF